MKRVFRAIIELIIEFFTNDEGPFDSLELCGWSKCPVSNKKIIEEDYSI